MLIPDHIRITVDPIIVNVKVQMENDEATQKQIDDLTARLLESNKKMEETQKKGG